MKINDLFEKINDDFDYDYIINTIENECGEMLEAYRSSGMVLYRGTSDKNMVFMKRPIRQDRKPVEMGEIQHELINKSMSKLGLPTRGNSLFVSADKSIAENWGSLHVVFIPDGWKGLVYDGIDAFDYSIFYLEEAASNIIYEYYDDEDEQLQQMEKSIKELKPRIFTTADVLEEALLNNTADILIQGQSYYSLSLDNRFKTKTAKIAKMLGIKL